MNRSVWILGGALIFGAAGCGAVTETKQLANEAQAPNSTEEAETSTADRTPAPSLIVRVPLDKNGKVMNDQAELRVLDNVGTNVDAENAGKVWRQAKQPMENVVTTELDQDSSSQQWGWRGRTNSYYYWNYNSYTQPYYYNYGNYYYYSYPQYYQTYYPSYYGYAYYYYPSCCYY